jgi:hypoxia up-regulated 1
LQCILSLLAPVFGFIEPSFASTSARVLTKFATTREVSTLTRMAPPGRRKGVFMLLSYFLLLIFFSSSASAASAVLGIDLGTEYLKAAIARPGSPIDIVLTKDSKRKEAASVAFKPSRQQTNDPEAFPERLYGGDALALSARFPGDVYSNLKTLLGLSLDSDIVTEYSKRFPALEIESIPRNDEKGSQGTVGFKSQNTANTKDAFMVEELLAMELKNIRANAEATVAKGTFVTDAVITCPSYYTAQEKRAVELAADLAGLRVLALVSDGLAVGINYATNRVFDSISDGAKPEHHLVYDMGAGSTTATVLKFQGRTTKGPAKRSQTIQEVITLGIGFDRTLGGDSLNAVILEDMVADIVGQPKVQKLGIDAEKLQKHGKSMSRLWKEAERMRQVLSANTAAYASFEGLYDDDLNVKYSLTRDKFEEIAVSHAARVDAPLLQALDQAGVALDELDSIILHGGAVRTPFVGKKLEAVAGGSSKIKANVNADEAAVMGAAFKAAAISPSFRVKDIRTTDISGSTFTLKWTADGKERQQKLFVPTSQVGAEKQVSVNSLEDIKFTFTQSNDEELAISEIGATNLTKSAAQLKDKYGCTPANISTIFTMRLDPANGLPDIVSGSVSCKAEGAKDGGVFDNVKGLFGFGSKKESDQNPLVDHDETPEGSTTETPLPVSDPTSSESTMSSASPSEDGSSSSADAGSASESSSSKAAEAIRSTVTIPIALKKTIVGFNVPPTKALPRIRQRLTEFDSSDRRAVLRSEALNNLEAFTYRARDYLDDPNFIAVSSDKARAELGKQLTSASDWLYGDGVDAKLQDFKDKLKELKALIDPVLNRKEENRKREEAVRMLQEGLEGVDGVIKMVQGNIEKAAEAAASSASSLASAASESAASAAASATETSSEKDELEEDPYSTTSADESEPTADEDLFKPYEYSQEDLDSLTKAHKAAETWLKDKLAAQKKLGPYDDPAVLVADLEKKAKDLQTLVSDTVLKSIKLNQPPPKKKSKTSKKPKTKTSKTSSTPSSTESPTTTASKSVKDEL